MTLILQPVSGIVDSQTRPLAVCVRSCLEINAGVIIDCTLLSLSLSLSLSTLNTLLVDSLLEISLRHQYLMKKKNQINFMTYIFLT